MINLINLNWQHSVLTKSIWGWQRQRRESERESEREGSSENGINKRLKRRKQGNGKTEKQIIFVLGQQQQQKLQQ